MSGEEDIGTRELDKDSSTLDSDSLAAEERYAGLATSYSKIRDENKELQDKVTQLTAMCYTLARRLRNEAFNDNMVSVQRQQMAELAMQSLVMSHEVWELVHKSEEQQQQNNI